MAMMWVVEMTLYDAESGDTNTLAGPYRSKDNAHRVKERLDQIVRSQGLREAGGVTVYVRRLHTEADLEDAALDHLSNYDLLP